MKPQNVQLDIRDRIAYITINRPEVRNALDLQTVNELHAVLEQINRSDQTGAVILTGGGDKVFVSGADIRDIRARNKMDALKGINSRLFKAVEDCEKPVVAAVNGFALGGGFELALSCDIRICSDNARFGLPEVSLGILPGAGGLYRLQRIAGLGAAKEMILTGNILDADRALQLGLVSEVVPQPKLMSAAQQLAEKILSRGPLAVRLAKRSLNLVTQMSTEAAMALDEYAQGILFESEDKMEGTTAFLEKRSPHFKGK
ncbi:MAG TPA: enoyl-CoA hydratase-related protein [Acidobacteriota bacterium]|nr:enoyl-CoA hydratase-related protein [Acidobacteriota bacterium]